jgi:Fe-S cluster assembly protein SufD
MKDIVLLPLKEAIENYSGISGIIQRYNIDNIDNGLFIYVPENLKIDIPFKMNLDTLYTLIILAPNSQLTYINETDLDNKESSISKFIEVHIDLGAHLYFIDLSRNSKKIKKTYRFHFSLRENAIGDLFFVDLSDGFVKKDVEVTLLGEKANSNIKGLYILEENELLQYHILQEHIAPFTNSNLVYKGILKDNSKGIFKGEIKIEREAKQSDAYQVNHTLILGENPSIDTIPILEIKNNDLKRCTHGATVGQVDEEVLFYMKSRGLDDRDAFNLLSIGFLEEIVEKLPSEAIKLEVWKYIKEKLEVNN